MKDIIFSNFFNPFSDIDNRCTWYIIKMYKSYQDRKHLCFSKMKRDVIKMTLVLFYFFYVLALKTNYDRISFRYISSCMS